MVGSSSFVRGAAALALTLVALPLIAAGCGGDDDDDDSPAEDGPQLAFSLPDVGEPVDIARIPFPNDLLRDEAGELDISVESLPFDTSANPQVMGNVAAAFADLDCFGPAGGVIFPLAEVDQDAAVDPGSLTDDSVLLIDLATGARIPSERHAREHDQEIYVRPERGVALAAGATYAVLVTRGARLIGGEALAPAPDFAAVLDGDESDRLAAAARAYAPLRDYLDSEGAPDPAELAGAAVFTTCDYSAGLGGVVDQLDDEDAPSFTVEQFYRAGAELDGFLGTPGDNRFPGVDNGGGIAHADIGFIALGTFSSPNYQSATPSGLGFWERDEAGRPIVKGRDDVPVILILPAPAAVTSYADLPVVVYTHGLGDSMSAVLAVANTLAVRGFAVIGIDIPFHGARFPGAEDNRHNFGGGGGPDGLADPSGLGPVLTFFNINGDEGVDPLDPRAQADSFRQAAVDLMALSRLVDGGDLSAVRAADPALADLSLRGDRIVYASESFGGLVGVLALAFEPRYQAAFMSVAGGGLLTDLLENSPTYGPIFTLVLGGAFGASPSDLELGAPAPPHSHRSFQFLGLLLGAGDPMTYAPRLPAKGVHVIMPAAFADESVPNHAGEALAAAMGLSWVPLPGAVEGPSHVAADRLPRAALPLSGNHRVGDRDLTAGFFELDPASHGMLTRRRGERLYEPGFPPFVLRADPQEFDNPIVELQAYLVEFAESYVGTGQPVIGQAAEP
jgi:hypothetical protein